MKIRELITPISGLLIFGLGFYAGQQFNHDNLSKSLNNITEEHPDEHNLATNNIQSNKPRQLEQQPLLTDNISEGNKEPILLPHEQDQSLNTEIAKEEQFYSDQSAEIELLQATVDSMIENKFPKDEIESLREQIAAIENDKFEDNVTGAAEQMTTEQLRDNLAQSLKQNTDISNEDLEAMIEELFPLEKTEAAGDDASPPM